MKRTLQSAVLVLALWSPVAALAQLKTYQLANPFPFPIQVRVLGDGPQFPQVLTIPAPPAPPLPVPYPDLSMRLQIKQPNGQWSPTLKVPWRSGKITLPMN
ncbi:MAG: hypothetical protein KF683_08095 [Rubrivivax sp.]|nr:hypothetical protein [Rubrivivax sp.]